MKHIYSRTHTQANTLLDSYLRFNCMVACLSLLRAQIFSLSPALFSVYKRQQRSNWMDFCLSTNSNNGCHNRHHTITMTRTRDRREREREEGGIGGERERESVRVGRREREGGKEGGGRERGHSA